MNKVNIIITHKCNLMCKHCYMNAGNKEIENCDIIFNKFKNIVLKIKAMNINEIMITGGECTISPVFLKMLEYCKENKIGVEAWSPLGSGACLNNPKIQEIANKYQKPSAQIILRWLLQKGIVILPKSVHENRIKENIDLFNFVLENEDVELINQLNQHKRTGPDPDNFDF